MNGVFTCAVRRVDGGEIGRLAQRLLVSARRRGGGARRRHRVMALRQVVAMVALSRITRAALAN